MGSACSRRRDQLEIEGLDSQSEVSGGLSRNISLRWPVKQPSFGNEQELVLKAGEHPTLLDIAVRHTCQVLDRFEVNICNGLWNFFKLPDLSMSVQLNLFIQSADRPDDLLIMHCLIPIIRSCCCRTLEGIDPWPLCREISANKYSMSLFAANNSLVKTSYCFQSVLFRCSSPKRNLVLYVLI